uniref:BZIP domain-containing protein n=1 Tax=Biomphalaria glabrata TaxID=6526 RepID=A0A2C9LSL4_BIOGL
MTLTLNNGHIKEEPISPPPSSTIAPRHMSGASFFDRGSRESIITPSPPAGTYNYYPFPVRASSYNSGSESQGSPSINKSKLKNKILDRRRANGQEEFGPLFEEEKHHELTQADLERRERRREQNRRAAKRCRNKKKSMQTEISKGTQELVRANNDLRKENEMLKRQIEQLRNIIDDHCRSGCCFLIGASTPYEHTHYTGAPFDTQISSAITGAHLALNNDLPPQASAATELPSEKTVNSLPSLDFFKTTIPLSDIGKNLDSHNLGNLPSWDLNNITSDLPALASEFGGFPMENNVKLEQHQPHIFPAVQQGINDQRRMPCIDPNLVQNVAKLPPVTSLVSDDISTRPPLSSATTSYDASQYGLSSSPFSHQHSDPHAQFYYDTKSFTCAQLWQNGEDLPFYQSSEHN